MAPNNQRNIRSITSATYFQSSCVYNKQFPVNITATGNYVGPIVSRNKKLSEDAENARPENARLENDGPDSVT